ncbi:MAG: ferredoxin [Anaerolineae bacterium]|nr:ferredoxin [Gloeobacterales cyanobacterium ES-bin-313]
MIPELSETVRNLNIGNYRWHLFLCADQTKPLCCDKAESIVAWDYLKRRVKDLETVASVFRTKANCLRVCQQGPILLVYPGGYWYRNANPEVIERVLQEHLLGGKPVEEFLFATNALSE